MRGIIYSPQNEKPTTTTPKNCRLSIYSSSTLLPFSRSPPHAFWPWRFDLRYALFSAFSALSAVFSSLSLRPSRLCGYLFPLRHSLPTATRLHSITPVWTPDRPGKLLTDYYSPDISGELLHTPQKALSRIKRYRNPHSRLTFIPLFTQ